MNINKIKESYINNKVYYIISIMYLLELLLEYFTTNMYPATMNHEIYGLTTTYILMLSSAWVARNT